MVPFQPPAQASVGPSLGRQALDWLLERMFTVEPASGKGAWLVRAGFLLGLALWAIGLLSTPVPELGASCLHWIHLPFHESGHFVFQPFGEFVHILGGTLGQLLVPAIVLGALLREGNPYGASVATWWLGTSFLDCAPYIDDARRRTLMLLSGETGQVDFEGHDWFQLLSRTGQLGHDHAIARSFWAVGALLILAALAWAGWLLWRQAQLDPAP